MLLSLLLVLALPDAASWPRFRGPTADGVAPANRLPTRLSNANLAWKVDLSGLGNGSPVIHSGRIFLQAATRDGSERLLLCHQLSDGKLLWERRKPGRKAQAHAKNSLASSTPAVDGQRVVYAIWDGSGYALVALDHSGKELWSRTIGPFVSHHGAGHSPILDEDAVYFVNDHDEGATVYCLDARSGAVRWQVDRAVYRASYSTPQIAELAGERVLLVASTAGVTGYRPNDGRVAWNWNWKHGKQPLRMVSSPVVLGDLVVASCGDGAGERDTVALRLSPSGPQLAWQLSRGVPYVPGCVPWRGRLYFVTDQGLAGALDAQTGKTLWTERLGGQGKVTASPVLAGGHLFACNEEGELFVWQAADQFRRVGRLDLGDGVLASPAIASDSLVIRTRSGLLCLRAGNDDPK